MKINDNKKKKNRNEISEKNRVSYKDELQIWKSIGVLKEIKD